MKKTILFIAFLFVLMTEGYSQMTRVAAIGDYGDDNQYEEGVADMVKGWNPEAIITMGDNNYPDGENATIDNNIGKYYREYIWPYDCDYCNSGSGSPTGTNRFWPSLGNHDWNVDPGGSPQPYLDYFELPGNEFWYDYVIGETHFFVVDSDPSQNGPGMGGRNHLDPTHVQPQWLKDQLEASTATWKIVYFHHPPYTTRKNRDPETIMRWPFKEWGADAVITGHNHHYERLIVDDFPYFVNGAGGREYLNDFKDNPPPESKRRVKAHGAMMLEYDDQSFIFKFYDINGDLQDTYGLGAGEVCTPDLSVNNLNVGSNTGSAAIDVDGLMSGWTASTSEPSWLNYQIISDTEILVSYTANNSSNSRTGSITITCDNNVNAAPITVTQAGTGTGNCSILSINSSMFFKPDGTPADDNIQWAQALGDEQQEIGTPEAGQTNGDITTTWQYPYEAGAQAYIELPQVYNLEKIWIYDGWGTGDFEVSVGLPQDQNPPFVSLSTDEGQGYIHEFDFPAGTQTQHLTFTRLSSSAKIVEIALCGSTGMTPICTPSFSTTNLNVNATAGMSPISVNGVADGWSISSSDESWLTVNNSNNTNIIADYLDNPSTNPRSATITFTCENGVQSNTTINVTQAGSGGNGNCSLLSINSSMFFKPDGTPANDNTNWGQALGDEQADIGSPEAGQTNGDITTTWQYPWQANAQTYIDLGQSQNIQKIWIVDGWGSGTFTVAEGLPSENNPPFYTLITDEGQGYIHEHEIPGGLQTQYLTFTKVTTSGKVVEIALCAGSGNNPTCNPSFGTNNLNVNSSAGNSDVSVSGIGTGWTVNTSDPSWITVNNQNDNNIDISYTTNTSSSSRSATITVICDNGLLSSPITITQSGTSAQDDLEVTVTPSQTSITPSTVFTSSLKIKNTTTSTMTGVTADCLNMNYNHSSGSGNAFTLQNSSTLNESHGSYNWWSAQWNIGTLLPGEEATIDFQFKIKTSSGCTPNILMETTASENSNDYVGSNTVDCATSFTSSTSDDLGLEKNEVSIFPNPATDLLQVIINNPTFDPLELLVTDQNGKRVLLDQQLIQKDNTNYELNIASLPVGVYFLYFNSDKNLKQQTPVKFVKMNK